MNDLNEANIDSLNRNQDFMLMIKAKKYVKEQCSIISFSRNYIVGRFFATINTEQRTKHAYGRKTDYLSKSQAFARG